MWITKKLRLFRIPEPQSRFQRAPEPSSFTKYLSQNDASTIWEFLAMVQTQVPYHSFSPPAPMFLGIKPKRVGAHQRASEDSSREPAAWWLHVQKSLLVLVTFKALTHKPQLQILLHQLFPAGEQRAPLSSIQWGSLSKYGQTSWDTEMGEVTTSSSSTQIERKKIMKSVRVV